MIPQRGAKTRFKPPPNTAENSVPLDLKAMELQRKPELYLVGSLSFSRSDAVLEHRAREHIQSCWWGPRTCRPGDLGGGRGEGTVALDRKCCKQI